MGASHGIMVWSDGHSMGYSMALQASHGIVWPGGHRMVYGMAWRASHGIWLWPGMQASMGLGIAYGMAWRAWYMVWLGGQGMVYGMAWWARHDILRTSHDVWYGLTRYVMVCEEA